MGIFGHHSPERMEQAEGERLRDRARKEGKRKRGEKGRKRGQEKEGKGAGKGNQPTRDGEGKMWSGERRRDRKEGKRKERGNSSSSLQAGQRHLHHVNPSTSARLVFHPRRGEKTHSHLR